MTEPRALGGPAAWTGGELAADHGWIRPWSQAAIDVILAALDGVRRQGLAWHEVTRDRFALPGLAEELAAVADELENGRGLVKLTGLPVEGLGDEDLRRLYFGLGHHLGTPVYQNARGERMGLICDEGPDVGLKRGQLEGADGKAFLSSRARAQSPAPLRWHTDRTDVVGLLCAGRPAEGGLSRIASSVSIHDAMVARRPDLAALLYGDVPRSRLGEEEGGGESFYMLPVWGVRDGRFTSHYSRTYVEAGQQQPGVPRMTDRQWQALDLLAELGEELCYEMTLEPGDIQLLNNHVVYHARAAYRDDPARGLVRRLYRLWLSMPNSRALPEGHEVLWGTVEAGALRGGIGQAPAGAETPAVLRA